LRMETDEGMPRSPCLIYSHSHSGNKAEGAILFEHFQEHFNFVVFDYTGYGYSEKDHCTLGVKESEDLDAVIMYVRQLYNFKRIYVWGRSQGAVTALLQAHKTASRYCSGMVLDAPFSSTKDMICTVMESVPNLVLYMLFGMLGDKLKEVTGADVMGIDLKDKVPVLKIPAFFIIPMHDKIAGTAHIDNLYRTYGGRFVITR
jgi:predicted alpha/beta-fold hydrolase